MLKSNNTVFSTGDKLEELFIPENFLFYDEKYFKFLVSQNKSDYTFFETKEPFITLDKNFVEHFFNNVKKVVRKDLFINLKNYDIIELSNL